MRSLFWILVNFYYLSFGLLSFCITDPYFYICSTHIFSFHCYYCSSFGWMFYFRNCVFVVNNRTFMFKRLMCWIFIWIRFGTNCYTKISFCCITFKFNFVMTPFGYKYFRYYFIIAIESFNSSTIFRTLYHGPLTTKILTYNNNTKSSFCTFVRVYFSDFGRCIRKIHFIRFHGHASSTYLKNCIDILKRWPHVG